MTKFDKRLFMMKDYLNNHRFDKQEVAGYLDVSERHLTRLLNHWELEKWIIYIRGQGRGNRSKVYFDDHLEQRYVNRVLDNLETISRKEIVEVLSLPISSLYKNIIKQAVDNMLIRPSKKKKGFVRYTKDIPGPEEGIFLHNSHYLELIFNISNRIYEMDDAGEIKKSLVRKDEWDKNSLILFLRKDIHFYNGHVLFAADVVKCLRDSFYSGLMQKYRHLIIDITELSPFKLRIEMKYKNDWIKYMLSSVKMTVYKEFKGEILTTGPFYIDKITPNTVKLQRNKYYYSETGDIGKIEMTSDRRYYFSRIKNIDIKTVYYSNYTNALMINPYKTDLSIEMRKMLFKYTAEFIETVLPESTKFENKLISMYEKYDLDSLSVDKIFSRTLKFFYHSDDKIAEYLIAFLIDKGMPIIGFEFNCSNNNDSYPYEGDIMFLSEQNSNILGLYNLLESSAFGTWFSHLEQTREYVNLLLEKPMDNWKVIERKYNNWLYENAYFIYLSSKAETLPLPVEYQNIAANIYGAIDFNSIVSKDINNTVE